MKLGHRLRVDVGEPEGAGLPPDFAKYVLHLPLRTSDVAATGWTSQMYREVIGAPALRFVLARPQRQGADRRRSRVPVFAVGGWYDNYVESDLEAYAALHKNVGLESHPGRTVAAQHVVPFRGRGFRTRARARRFARCSSSGSTSG